MDSHAYEVALEQRARARRALDEARAAAERLREARSRAERLLETIDPVTGLEARTTLRARMRRIESRMLATDELMRSAERSLVDRTDALPSPADGDGPGAPVEDVPGSPGPSPAPTTRRS